MQAGRWAAVAVMTATCAIHAADVTPDGTEQTLPELVVTPTGEAMPAERIGQSVSVIMAADIEAHGWRTLAEALRTVPGLHINQSGAPGSTVGLVLRGSRSSQVLVLVDGKRLNDPSGPTREAEIAAMDLANVERIEVLRGPQSGLYGSDAMAGVINIVTRRPASGLGGEVSAEGGSYGTWRTAARLQSATERLSASVHASYLSSDGFSSANRRFPGNREDDGMASLNMGTTLGARVADGLRLEGHLQYMVLESDYDNGGGPAADAVDAVADTEQVLAGIRAELGSRSAVWRQALSLKVSVFDREFDDDFGRIRYKGETLEGEWRHDVSLGKAGQLTAGLNYRDESARTGAEPREDADMVGLYLQHHAAYGPFDTLVGGRYDHHEAFGDAFTWRVAPVWRIRQTGSRLRAAAGTGFKAPSLYQLYAPATAWGAVGNPDLDPERSLGWEAGVDQSFASGRLTFGATYFESRVEDQIEFVNGYENVSRVESRGVELLASCRPLDALRLNASYTRTETKDRDLDEYLIRIPKDRASLSADVSLPYRTHLATTVVYTGAFDDRYFDATMFSAVDARVESAVVVNLAARVDVSDRLTIFGRIDNLFDEDYEEVYGYGTAGVSGYGGVRLTL